MRQPIGGLHVIQNPDPDLLLDVQIVWDEIAECVHPIIELVEAETRPISFKLSFFDSISHHLRNLHSIFPLH